MSRVRTPSIALFLRIFIITHIYIVLTVSILQAIILGFIQGITEFLPISSSGHLLLGQYLLGFHHLDHYILFDLICHLGTLLAIFLFFSQEIKALFKDNKTQLLQLFFATLPLFPLVFLLKPIKHLFASPEYLGLCFLFTAVLLYLGIRVGDHQIQAPTLTTKESLPQKLRDALFIGCFQACAILPGVSRSGATISAAKLLRWTPSRAVTFSFLLAIPAILGATALELLQLLQQTVTSSTAQMSPTPPINIEHYSIGFLTSLGIGYISLLFLMKVAMKGKFMYFVWYCLLIGVTSFLYFNFIPINSS